MAESSGVITLSYIPQCLGWLFMFEPTCRRVKIKTLDWNFKYRVDLISNLENELHEWRSAGWEAEIAIRCHSLSAAYRQLFAVRCHSLSAAYRQLFAVRCHSLSAAYRQLFAVRCHSLSAAYRQIFAVRCHSLSTAYRQLLGVWLRSVPVGIRRVDARAKLTKENNNNKNKNSTLLIDQIKINGTF